MAKSSTCFRLDIFDGNKMIDAKVVEEAKLKKTVQNLENEGYVVRKRKVEC